MSANFQSFTKLGDTIDLSTMQRGTVFDTMVIKVASTGNDPNFVVRDIASLGHLWAVNLIPWQLPGKFGAQTSSRNRTVLVNSTARALITIGSDGATESYFVDYPAAGTTVVVSGQQLQVDLVGQVPPGADPTFFPPVIGAYVSPASGRPGVMSATLTTQRDILAPTSSTSEAVPPRARGYRIITGLDPLPAAGLLMTQVNGHGDTLALQDRVNYTDAFFNPSARAQWYPLHPDCQSVTIVNRDVTDTVGFSVQWILETAG